MTCCYYWPAAEEVPDVAVDTVADGLQMMQEGADIQMVADMGHMADHLHSRAAVMVVSVGIYSLGTQVEGSPGKSS